MAKIAVVEDDETLANRLARILASEHHTVEVVRDGTEAEFRLLNYAYDLIVLDWNLPGKPGPEICQAYRNHRGQSPILMLTGNDGVDHKVAGFQSGADDYLTKPFHPAELLARVSALLRRPSMAPDTVHKLGDLIIDLKARTVKRNDIEIRLQPKEFALLEFLLKHPDEAFGQDALLQRIWSSESESTADAVRTQVKNLRRKLCAENADAYITTVFKVGYKLAVRPENGQ